jgi:hypothetical protein
VNDGSVITAAEAESIELAERAAHDKLLKEGGVRDEELDGFVHLDAFAGGDTEAVDMRLLTAIRDNDWEIAEHQLHNGADANARLSESCRSTALLTAVAEGKTRMVSLLLKHKADVNIPDRAGFTPLMIAASRPCGLHLVKVLIEHGAGEGVDLATESGDTALHLACANGILESVKEILKLGGACKNMKNLRGRTPLFEAALRYDRRIIHALLIAGATPRGTDERGRSLQDIARAHNHMIAPTTMEILKNQKKQFDNLIDGAGAAADSSAVRIQSMHRGNAARHRVQHLRTKRKMEDHLHHAVGD